jgi:putative transposase
MNSTRPRHWRNEGLPGDTPFVTSTCLDFALLFYRSEMKSRLTMSLLDDPDYYCAKLHAFVVMPHHFHLLLTLGPRLTGPGLVQRLKQNARKRLGPLLLPGEKKQLRQQIGLNRHAFWERSYRSVVLEAPGSYRTRRRYIHRNPVRAKYVERCEDYEWSSAWAYAQGFVSEDGGLDVPKVLSRYATEGVPWPSKKRRTDGTLRMSA